MTTIVATVKRPKRPPQRENVRAELVQAAIDASGLSYGQISRKMGVAEKTVQRWRNGDSGVPLWAWPQMLELLGLPRDWTPPAPPKKRAPN